MWNCLRGHALKRSPGIIRKSMVSYPGPGFLSSATWPLLPKKHLNGLINQSINQSIILTRHICLDQGNFTLNYHIRKMEYETSDHWREKQKSSTTYVWNPIVNKCVLSQTMLDINLCNAWSEYVCETAYRGFKNCIDVNIMYYNYQRRILEIGWIVINNLVKTQRCWP